MNKYEVLFDEIIRRTQANELDWRQVPRAAHAALIFNPSRVFRQFAADLPRGHACLRVLLVEKRLQEATWDTGEERCAPELLVVDEGGELITTLTDSVIERRDLCRLASMVEVRGDKARHLFAAVPASA